MRGAHPGLEARSTFDFRILVLAVRASVPKILRATRLNPFLSTNLLLLAFVIAFNPL